MPVNQHWPRWIFASICKHFTTNCGNFYVYCEGEAIEDRGMDLLELRINGPHFWEQSKDVWKSYVEINVLIQSILRDNDFHYIHKQTGIVAAAFVDAIPVKKYGDGDAFLECLKLDRNAQGGTIKINHFGQIGDNNFLQASVEGNYEITINL